MAEKWAQEDNLKTMTTKFNGNAQELDDIKAVIDDGDFDARIGPLDNLVTEDKTNLVAAINETFQKGSIQADWNSTDTSSLSFIKNIPNSIKSINNSSNFRIKKFSKVDNRGYPTYRIINELTNYHPTNRPSNWKTYGFSVVALCAIRDGNGQSLEPAFMYASLGYEYNMLKSTSGVDFPVVLHNIESDKYYVAIRTNGSYKSVTLIGDFCNPDIELGEEILAQDSNGTPQSGWELTYRPEDMLIMEQLQAGRANDALKLAWTRLIKLTGDMTGDIHFDGSEDITVNTTVNESKHAVNADSATTADDSNKLGGYPLNSSSTGGHYGTIPCIMTDGVMEIGKYIDWHAMDSGTEEYSSRWIAEDNGTVSVGTINGTLNGNASTAMKAIQDASGNVIENTYATKTELSEIPAKLTFDTTPTANSTNPVTSDGVKKYVDSALASLISADDKSY